MYIGPWQEFQLANKVRLNHVPSTGGYGMQVPVGKPGTQIEFGGHDGSGGGYRGGFQPYDEDSRSNENYQGHKSGAISAADGGGSVMVGKDMVDNLQQQVDYLARLLEQQGASARANVDRRTSQQPISIPRPARVSPQRSVASNASSMRRKQQQRGMRNVRGGKNNSAVGYSRILSSVPRQQMAQINLNTDNYNTNYNNKPPMSARSYNSDLSLNSRFTYSHSEPGDNDGPMPSNVGLVGTQKFRNTSTHSNAITSMREMSHSAPTDGAEASVGNGFAVGGANHSSATAKKFYGGGYNKNLAARMLKVNRAARKKGFTELGNSGNNDNIRNLFHTKGLVGRGEGSGGTGGGAGGGGGTDKRRASVEMVKQMHKLYTSGAVGGAPEGGGKDNPTKQLNASPPGGGGVSAVRSLKHDRKQSSEVEVNGEVQVVQNMNLTKEEFSQVSKYFGIDLEEFEEGADEGVNFAAAAAISGQKSRGSGEGADGGGDGTYSVPMTPMTPGGGTANASVDDLINWVGGLNETELDAAVT